MTLRVKPPLRASLRWLLPATLLALAPKCVVCVLAYAGVGAALGIGGPELCGAASETPTWQPGLASAVLVILAASVSFLVYRHCRRLHFSRRS